MRKLLMLAVVALAAVAFAGVSAGSASAFTLYQPGGFQVPCPSVSLQDGEVSGGCLTEGFDGGLELYVSQPNPVTVGHYAVTFDLAFDAGGDGYAVDPTVDATGPYVAREACDESDGSPLPWAVDSFWEEWFELKMRITVGMRPSAAGPGGSCVQQQIVVDATEVGAWSVTVLEQAGASANVRNGLWESSDDMWIDW